MIFVTGATGILGRALVLELLKRGKAVRAAKRPTSNLNEVRNSFRFYTDEPDVFFDKIEWVDIDFEDAESLQAILEGVAEVYHCAAKVSFHPKDSKKMYRTNVEGTKNLLYACEGSSVQKFLFVSSIAVLDGVNENGVVDEGSDYNPKISHSAYAVSKHFSEMEVWRASAEGLNTVIINPGMIIGSGNWSESSGELFSNFEKSAYTFPGGTAYVDVRDVAKIAAELMDRNIFGKRFILISENRKYADLASKIRSKLGNAAPKVISQKLLKAAPLLSPILSWVFPALQMANRVNVEAVSTFVPLSNQKIKEEIDFQFIPVDESLDFHLKNYISDKK